MTHPHITPRGHMANLVAKAQPAEAPDAGGFCPLMSQTLQLLPVRYGLVEDLEPSVEIAMPYTLQALPLGFRLLRDGYLYIIDSATGFLHEYSITDGSIAALLFKGDQITKDRRPDVIEADPALAFSRSSVLHVSFSEVQWTAFKCAQVMKVATEREYFMQRVSFENIQRGNARDLINDRKMALWLAESSGSRADKPDDNSTRIPYDWEHTPLYRQTIIEEFTSQITTAHKRDFLFLAVRDDVGVMRDLAQYQDQVVGQIEKWALSQQGEVERDYLLGCYIESLTQINEEDLNERAKKDRTLKALLDDLEILPEPERTQTRNTLREVMSQDNRQEAGAYFNDSDVPADLQERLEKAKPDRLSMDDGIEARASTIQQYQLEQRFVGTSPAFIARHRKSLWKLYRQMDKPTKDALYGAKFGQRGINDLIDRPRMDVFLKKQRAILQPLNELLEKITQDRIDLLIKNRLHRAIWYYDVEDSEQVDHALLTEYACLKDICRSDKAVDSVLDWLNNNPAMSRPMFYAAPLSAQTELGVQFAVFTNASWLFFKDAPQWLERLKRWGAGVVLDTGRLSPASQVNLTAAWGTLAPALQMGIQQAVQAFLQQMDKGQLPDMDTLFRSLPKAAGVTILDAARRENVAFQIASAEDLEALGKTVQAVQKERKYLRYLNNEAQQSRAKHALWHTSTAAENLKLSRQATQERLRSLEEQLAKAMSPLADLPSDTTHLQPASSGKPGLALVFPAQQHQEVKTVLDNYRRGVTVAPKAGLLGDGAGLLVFVAQVVNFVQVKHEMNLQPEDAKSWAPFVSSLAATVAAGFGAAQGIADTALSAHATVLAKNLQKAELLGVHVQMGKLHIGLGMVGYISGTVAAAMSLYSSHKNWSDAVRNGNSDAQTGAAVSMLGNSGFLASNSYGGAQTGIAFKHVLATARNSPARIAAWAAAGTRLSTVFLRFNVAGILFTALELSGSWFYNRNNLSLHDRWLLSTPWSKDDDQRRSLPLSDYQKEFRGHVQAPRMQIVPSSDDPNNLQPRLFLLHFPTLSTADLAQPIGGYASSVLLNIGGYQVVRAQFGRDHSPEQWTPLKENLQETLQLHQVSPLILRLNDISGLITSPIPGRCDLVLSIQLGHRTPEGLYEANLYDLRVPVTGENGDFPAIDLEHLGEQCPHFNINPASLPKAQD
ncbi:toxin VasX [Pseudomonas caspiana]|uniref:toxin VasX n=1 Tax=Pseudomonas caspiana TaxID=1451454 RepID=UPI0032EF098C